MISVTNSVEFDLLKIAKKEKERMLKSAFLPILKLEKLLLSLSEQIQEGN